MYKQQKVILITILSRSAAGGHPALGWSHCMVVSHSEHSIM